MTSPVPGNNQGMTETAARPHPPIVVGVDGSDPSLLAADLAADEADLRQLPLEILHAFALPFFAPPSGTVPGLPPMTPVTEQEEPLLRVNAERVLHEAAERVRAVHPDLPMISRLRDGIPAEVLTDAARHATMIFVGHRGVGGFAELLTGSVGIQLANHSAAPTVIVRGDPRGAAGGERGPVVVGIDGSEGSRRAAEYALETAAVHGVPVLALYAWPVDAAWPPALAQAGTPPPSVPNEVTDILTAVTHQYPEVQVNPQVRQGVSAHQALVEASADASLVVVGSRGRGGFKGLLLGSTSQALIHHARCPVAVIGPETELVDEVTPAD
jgi:nucleotide-binding universal stress UspA family protein